MPLAASSPLSAVSTLRKAFNFTICTFILAFTAAGLAGRLATAPWTTVEVYIPDGCESPPPDPPDENKPPCENATVTLSVASISLCSANSPCRPVSYAGIRNLVDLGFGTPLNGILQHQAEVEAAQAFGVLAIMAFTMAIISSGLSAKSMWASIGTGHESPHCGCLGTARTVMSFVATGFSLLFIGVVLAADFLVTQRIPEGGGAGGGGGLVDDPEDPSDGNLVPGSGNITASYRRLLGLGSSAPVSQLFVYDITGSSYAAASVLIAIACLGFTIATKVSREKGGSSSCCFAC